MIRLRSGYKLKEVMAFTLKNATVLLDEIDKVETQAQLRLAQAFHSPKSLVERRESKESKKKTNTQLVGEALAGLDPKKFREMEMYRATRNFIKAQNGRRK